MAVTITRSVWIDDDGTGQSGTVINQALHTTLYNEIDTALAKVAQLSGGNTFTGNQAITGLLSVSSSGVHTITVTGAGLFGVVVQNALANAASFAQVAVGNDTAADLVSLFSSSSQVVTSADYVANGSTLRQKGAGGLILSTTLSAPIRVFTNNLERLRIVPTGELWVNATANALGPMQLLCAVSASNTVGLGLQNLNPSNALYYMGFYNSANGTAGSILQTGATTVAYNTTSDARLKQDDGRAIDLAALRAVVIHDFRWKADGVRDRGIFAQEAHALYPRAVSKGSDDLTDTGDLKTPWMTDYSKFVPDLIVGWQQHDAELAALRALLVPVKG